MIKNGFVISVKNIWKVGKFYYVLLEMVLGF